MLLNVAKNITLRSCDIIGVFNTDTATASPITRDFLNRKQKSGDINTIENIPNSFVLYADKTGSRVYLAHKSAGQIIS